MPPREPGAPPRRTWIGWRSSPGTDGTPRPAGRPRARAARRGLVGPLFAGGPVDRLADEIGMAVVPGVLLDHVHDDPAQARALTIRPAPRSESVQAIGAGERAAGARHCLLPQGEVLRGGLLGCQAPFPVGVGRPVGLCPRLGEVLTEEHTGEPVLFYPGQMGEDPPE